MNFNITSSGPGFWIGAALITWLLLAILGVCVRNRTHWVQPALLGAGSLILALLAIFGGEASFCFPAPWYLGNAQFSFFVDPLSRWFLGIIGIVGIASAFFSPGYLDHLKNKISIGIIWAALAILFASMTGVIIAANAISFLFAWELMALSSFALVAADHERRSIRRAAMIYLGATRTGTGFLMAGFLWMHHLTGSWSFHDWHIIGPTALVPALLIFIGLATKAGCWPFHIWLPIAHPAAPAPVSAVMSGIMIKTAIYAMIRFFIIGSPIVAPHIGFIILTLGAISAFWGVLFALLQQDLKRLLAYCSVENIGIILMGIGIAILGREMHLPLMAQFGLVAALFHTLNHAIFKGLLFFCTGTVDARTHIRDVEKLGGLIHRMPWTAATFIIGSMGICALPPLNGFASEWMLYRSFFELAMHGSAVGVRWGGLLLMGWLAMTGALAIACFVKAVGVVFLGLPRSKQAASATEGDKGMVASQAILAGTCIALGLSVPALLVPLGRIAVEPGTPNLLRMGWTIPLPMLAILLVATVTALAVWLITLSRKSPARKYITWECGFGKLGSRMQYTGSSFAQPISRLFGAVYNYKLVVRRNRRQFSDNVVATLAHEPYLETRVYTPLTRVVSRLSGIFLLRLQAGSIHQYLLNMIIVLLLLLWLGYRR